ncbi:ABC1 family protein, mitochondrial [Purpureocillium lavendulum]|uniref:ABC1 family protein, mitochondrial n=1 Tax=Purpureocillium lavendulum TaxID=1247861 RepID=A0AB34FLG6_9HYPO|nr:ABC1 family protein, mitochondrial [Purpureocillium lavendulum]
MSQEQESGSKRATEVTDAMLNVPGYADDSMFFLVRYGERAKADWRGLVFPPVRSQNTLRKCDWEDLQSTINQISELWVKAGGGGHTPEDGGEESLEGRRTKAKELREHALSIVEPFPDLARDFDRFQAACRTAYVAINRPSQKK